FEFSFDHFATRPSGEAPLPGGRYLVGVRRADSRRFVATRVVEVGDGRVPVSLSLPPTEAADAIVLSVLDPASRPVDDVEEIVARQEDGRGFATLDSSRGSSSEDPAIGAALLAFRKADGTHWIPHDQKALRRWIGGPDPRPRLTLTVRSARYGPREVLVPRERRGPLTVQYADGATLEVAVAGYEGSGLEERLWIALTPLGNPGHKLPRTLDFAGKVGPVARGGRMGFGPVPPGDHELTLLAETGDSFRGSGTFALVRKPLRLEPGANEATVELPPLHVLEVEVGEAGSVEITRVGERGGSQMYRERDETSVRFERLPAGTYAVSAGTGRATIVRVPEVDRFRYDEGARPDAILVIEATDPLAGTGFLVGDIVIAADGARIAWPAPSGLLARETVRFTVLRGGGEVAIDAPPGLVLAGRGVGDGLVPVVSAPGR
ncbi:MAG: PDZ domain-containing protein, partial [Planctomycetes bacterium]|nr:PDZ domain-containing protein [Planctomycetota bacterium]